MAPPPTNTTQIQKKETYSNNQAQTGANMTSG
jgi:hypothetical protein